MSNAVLSTRSLGIARAIIGLIQGLALYLLYLAYEEKVWPATYGLIFAPLLLVALLVPLLASQALGNMSRRTFDIWIASAALLVGALAFYDNWRAWPVDFDGGVAQPHILPSPELCLALVGSLFIAQALIVGGDTDRRFAADYRTYFDVAWKQGVQLVLTIAFCGVFWGLLLLGAGLFDLIKIDLLSRLISHRWFAIPATTLAAALAIHATDVRAGIVRGIRTLGLALLSWLLVLMTLIVCGFLTALLATGLEPLFATRFTTPMLLLAAASLVLLINAAYQDGDPEHGAPRLLRYAAVLAALALAPLVLLGGYALSLRVDQYGWTTERIFAAACVFLAGFYAAGYAVAALWSAGPWFKRIERWNFYASLFALAIVIALFTPIADPSRISVSSQVARLNSGAIPAEELDYDYLRWEGGHFGKVALDDLAANAVGPKGQVVREAASRALRATDENGRRRGRRDFSLAENITVHPQNGQLPESFMAKDWGASSTPRPPGCLVGIGSKCDALMVDVNKDGQEEIAIVEPNLVTVFQTDPAEVWKIAGYWSLRGGGACPEFAKAMIDGSYALIPPEPPTWPDLEIAGLRMRFGLPAPLTQCPGSSPVRQPG